MLEDLAEREGNAAVNIDGIASAAAEAEGNPMAQSATAAAARCADSLSLRAFLGLTFAGKVHEKRTRPSLAEETQ